MALQKLEPQVDGFKIKGKLKSDIKTISGLLRSISFLELAAEKDVLNVAYVESRDINKNPYLFSIIKIKSDELEVLYSIPSEIGPNRRRMDVIRYLLNVLSLIESSFSVDNSTVYQLIENALKDISGMLTADNSKLYASYDSMKKEVVDLQKRIERLNEQNQALTTKNYELKNQSDEMKLKIDELETLSDDTLRAKLQDWIIEHNGAIVISEFSKVYKVPDTRAEQMLNKLVSEGYLEISQ